MAENGFGNFAIEIAPDFAYIHSYDTEEELHRICFSLVVPVDDGFLENLYRRYKPQFACDIALISLFHEIGHIINGDYGITFDEEGYEDAADRYAADKLIPPEKYQTFIQAD